MSVHDYDIADVRAVFGEGAAQSARRLGLRGATADRFGTLRLRTMGRRTGEERQVIVGYLEEGSNLVLVAMNGWADTAPAWWLNLHAHPDATVDLPEGSREVTGRVANKDERLRLWPKLTGPWTAAFGDLDAMRP